MRRKLLSAPYLVWILCGTLIPMAMVFYYGLTGDQGGFTLSNIAAIAETGHAKALWTSVLLSLVSTVICLLLAYPLGLILKKSGMGQKGLLVFLFVLPMWMKGVINTILQSLGFSGLRLINTPAAIVMGMVYDFLPFMVMPIYNVLAKIDDRVIEAARDLGANNFQVFRYIILPLSVPGIVSGVTMVFVPALTTFVISNMLGGGKILLIGNVIEQEFTVGNNWHLGAGLSLVMMIFILVSMAFIAKFDKNGEGNTF